MSDRSALGMLDPTRPSLVATAPVPTSALEDHARLGDMPLNFRPIRWTEAVRDPDWRTDRAGRVIAREAPGDPAPDGAFVRACRALDRYEFADPRQVRALFDAASPLEGRDLLLVGRFLVLRFHLGVRIDGVVDDEIDDAGRRVRRHGWRYRTLEGHLEQGEMRYEVRKDVGSGSVAFGFRSYSRSAGVDDPVVRLGFAVFGRREQLRFYRSVLDRMEAIAGRRT